MSQVYEEKQEYKRERYVELIARAKRDNEAYAKADREFMDCNMGSPILVGHHSEGKHRREIARMENRMRKLTENLEKIKYWEHKIKLIDNPRQISGDNPEAQTLIDDKVTKLEKEREVAKQMKKDLKAKKDKTNDEELKIYYLESHISNLGTKIRAAKKRLEKMAETEAMPETDETINDVRIFVDKDENRIKIEFGYKPDEDTRTQLKRQGFRWSPRNEAWQSYIHDYQLEAGRKILRALK